ncbi:MAG: bifunctional biotin--[acetyl-CoA-carboxylase] ligase/biotin operon repressor BirA [Gammaproteobacteria bacterium]
MPPVPLALLSLLADSRFHSGQALGAALGVTRSAVWKAMRVCAQHGIEIHSVRGKGYRLAQKLDLLHEQSIKQNLETQAQRLLTRLEIHSTLDSTSTHLLRMSDNELASGVACLAESQHTGRGRHGRHWISPFGANIYLSVLWRFAVGPAALSGLSLAMGVAVLQSLQALGVSVCGLKWPNDILCEGRKLAGILLDIKGEASGPSSTVVGIGVNVRMPEVVAAEIDQPWTDLNHIAAPACPSRNQIAAQLLGQVVIALDEFDRAGFTPFQARWMRWDCLAGRQVNLQLPHQTVRGRACGIDERGALLLEVQGEVRAFTGGEVSLRAAS